MRKIFNKRGDGAVGMSFGWMFSLLLIIFFILAAIYGIRFFLDMSQCSQVGLFYDELKDNVADAYKSPSSDFEMKINIPGVKQICFANLSDKISGSLSAYEEINLYEIYDANVFLIPSSKACDMPYNKIPYLNISKITASKNPLCFDISDGGKIKIVKNFGERGVTIR
jgi:hypothetical protein